MNLYNIHMTDYEDFICLTCGEDYHGALRAEGWDDDICVNCVTAADNKKSNVVPFSTLDWNDRIALDLALILEGTGDSIEDLLNHYKITKSDLRRFSADAVFRMRVSHFRKEIVTEGLGFRMKARVQAEELLTTSWNLIHDAGVSPNVKADLIKSTVKWAGLEPRPDAGEGGGNMGGVRISINLGNADKPLIEREVYDDDTPAIIEQ